MTTKAQTLVLFGATGDLSQRMLLPSLWIIHTAHRHGAPTGTLVRMAGNAGLDWMLGSLPLVGDLFDLFFKSHRRNAALLREVLA